MQHFIIPRKDNVVFTALMLFFLLFFFSTPLLLAQNSYKITGKVSDSKTGKPLAGTNISVPGTTRGTSSDAQGNYVITLNKGTTKLVFSFIGYRSDTLTVKAEPGSITHRNVMLAPETLRANETTVYANALVHRVRNLAHSRDERRKKLKNYSVKIHKLGILYRTAHSAQDSSGRSLQAGRAKTKKPRRAAQNSKLDTSAIKAYSERVARQMYVSPRTFGERYLARRSSANFFSQYEIFSAGGAPINLNENEVNVYVLGQGLSIAGPISANASRYYRLKKEPADSSWPAQTVKIIIHPKSSKKPLFRGTVYVDNKIDKVIGMNLKLNEAGNVHAGIYSLTDFHYYQRYKKVQNYWLPGQTVITGRLSIVGLGKDFVYRDTWQYGNYRLNEPGLRKDDIPLSGVEVVANADNRNSAYWNQIIASFGDNHTLTKLQKAREHQKNRFLTNFFFGAVRTFYKAPKLLSNFYFTNISDFYRFNRVEGSYVGIGLRTPAVKKNYTYKGAVGYATEANDLRYKISGLQFIPGGHLGVEGGYYQKLAEQFGDYRYKEGPLNVDRFENTLVYGFSGVDSHNYFQRKGFEAGLRWRFRRNFFIRADYRHENQTFLPVVAPHSFFRHYNVGKGQVIDSNLNPRVGVTPDGPVGPDGLQGFTEGHFSGLAFQFHLDNRQFQESSIARNYKIRQFGWFTDNLAYWADPAFGFGESDAFNYVKYRSAFGVRIPLFTSQFLLGKVYVGGTDKPLPAQVQFGSNGFYIDDYLRRQPLETLGFNEGVGNRVSVARIDYIFGSSIFRLFPIKFIRQSGVQLRVWGAAGYRHRRAGLIPVTPFTDGREQQIEVGVSVTQIFGLFSINVGFRLKGNAGESVSGQYLF